MALGEELKKLREARGLKLRQVEEKSGISNGYLTQLENNKIKEPSPNILHKLADVYNVPYSKLMRAAGYFVPAPEKEAEVKPSFANSDRLSSYALSTANLNPEEEEALVDYLRYLRFKRKGKK
jgi:transcriptional regulator with XRE-family HTH domain